MKTLLFTNHKGGTGKTTLCREIGLYLAAQGDNVLFIDLDPQANLTKSLCERGRSESYKALTGEKFTYTSATHIKNILLLSGSMSLASLEKQLLGELDAYTRLQHVFIKNKDRFRVFKYCVIDSPPSLGILTLNGLVACDYAIIPMNPAIYSMQGTADLITTITKVQGTLNRQIAILGFVINAYDAVPVITKQIVRDIREGLGYKVFNGMVSRSIKIEEAIAKKQGILSFPRCKVQEEIISLGKELCERLGAVYER